MATVLRNELIGVKISFGAEQTKHQKTGANCMSEVQIMNSSVVYDDSGDSGDEEGLSVRNFVCYFT